MKDKERLELFFKAGGGRKWVSDLHGFEDKSRVTSMRASLRRCKTTDDVMLESSFYTLWNAWLNAIGAEKSYIKKRDFATFALVAAELKGESFQTLADAMSASEGDKATVSGLRFRKLIKSRNEDFVIQLRRIVRQVQSLKVLDLAQISTSWNDFTRQRLAENYYKNAKTEQ